SLNRIEEDNLDGDRIFQKNSLYLRSSKDAELRSFLFFLNYFSKNTIVEDISSKVKINTSKDDVNIDLFSKNEIVESNLEKKQFLYGYLDFNLKDKNIGQIELKGLAEENNLKINTVLDEKTTINLLKTVR
ncbi:MAG: hypothetical protein ACRC6J_00115, partial [Cetobacterium sp.]